jgi:hypothetical protein
MAVSRVNGLIFRDSILLLSARFQHRPTGTLHRGLDAEHAESLAAGILALALVLPLVLDSATRTKDDDEDEQKRTRELADSLGVCHLTYPSTWRLRSIVNPISVEATR